MALESSASRYCTLAPTPTLHLHPDDAAGLGIAAGDPVIVTGSSGEATLDAALEVGTGALRHLGYVEDRCAQLRLGGTQGLGEVAPTSTHVEQCRGVLEVEGGG